MRSSTPCVAPGTTATPWRPSTRGCRRRRATRAARCSARPARRGRRRARRRHVRHVGRTQGRRADARRDRRVGASVERRARRRRGRLVAGRACRWRTSAACQSSPARCTPGRRSSSTALRRSVSVVPTMLRRMDAVAVPARPARRRGGARRPAAERRAHLRHDRDRQRHRLRRPAPSTASSCASSTARSTCAARSCCAATATAPIPRTPTAGSPPATPATITDGVLHVDGRIGDVINTGGEKVWPIAVERALEGCAGHRRGRHRRTPATTSGARRVVAFVVPRIQ